MRTTALGLILAAATWMAACGPDAAFEQALSRERAGAYAVAAERYQRFVDRHPADRRVPEAIVRAARLYLYAFQRCPEARPWLERAARDYSNDPWAKTARRMLLDCPDYLPVRPGATWVFVDSATGGKNMRLEVSARSLSQMPEAEVELESVLFAGQRKFQTSRRRYLKEDWAIWELDGADRVPVLRYPYRPGNSWSARRAGARVDFRVESAHETVTVKAGTFHECLKVRESQPGLPAWKFDYYAPGVGRVKTTVGGPRFENPNTELAKVLVPFPDLSAAP